VQHLVVDEAIERGDRRVWFLEHEPRQVAERPGRRLFRLERDGEITLPIIPCAGNCQHHGLVEVWVAVGAGEVDWPAFFSVLDKLKYTGDLVIEREAGNQRVADIRQAKDVLGTVAI
jgi:hypothetical protein